ncbi:aldehyde oxidase-like isoform X2 [Dendrobates tinctorius]|uniref:aldehyde oxidase-like isoform X2 n=1 Tax=Dendrobates tinctorius TaxID=92724 RepID=UPI003CCA3162
MRPEAMVVGAASDQLIFYVNGRKIIEEKADPEQMLLPYLRRKLNLTGTKYGCGEGGCGSCTVMISHTHPVSKKIHHYSANACLLPICSLYGAAITTVEGIGGTTSRLHPVQERIAKAHGSQCGFCSPGMVMSIYSLLRNHPEPTMEQIYEALGGNLCRCTGYRAILDGCKTLCKEPNCCKLEQNGQPDHNQRDNMTTLFVNNEDLVPVDPTQELIFPPELALMIQNKSPQSLVFQGEKVKWITVFNLEELLDLKVMYPEAPLMVGNTSLGLEIKSKGVFYPVIISIGKIPDLNIVKYTKDGLSIGAACTLSMLKETLEEAVSELSYEKTKTFRVLLKQLKTLAGQQIRNVASLGGHIISRNPNSDLNPILACGNTSLSVLSKGKTRQIICNEDFFRCKGSSSCLLPKEVLVSVFIPFTQKWEVVSAFRQAQRKVNSMAILVAGMRVLFQDHSDIIEDMNIYFGGTGTCTVQANKAREAVIGRQWNEETLGEACRFILDEISLTPSAPGGKVEYRRTLTVSFLFKFYLEVLQALNSEYSVKGHISPVDIAQRNNVKSTVMQNTTLKSMQKYQDITAHQPTQDAVGRPVMHHAAMMQVSGEAVYCDDMPIIEGELFLALVTSSKAHAKIISLDVTGALSMPGVCDIITAKDVPGTNNFSYYDWPDQLLADNTVMCVGYIICAVVADKPERAKRAAKKVKIVYEDIKPVIFTIEDAIKHDSFFEPDKKLQCGDVDEAFKTADHILEGEIHIGGQEHFYMETQSIRVIPIKEGQEIEIYAASQDPTYMQGLVARSLGIPFNRVNCHVKRIGGAFGGKIVKTAYLAAISAVAAQKTKRPIRCVLERDEDMLIKGGRHPFLGRYKIGYMKDGRIVAADINMYSNGGYSGTESVFIMEASVLQMDASYHIPALRCHGRVCKTNLPSNISFRGFGFPQCALITEVWIDEVAAKCNLPPHQAAALVHIYCDGSVLVSHGGTEMGQGIHTKIIQIATRELGIPMCYIHICETNTGSVPNTIATAATVGADVNGMAVKDACEKLRKRFEPIVSKNPEGNWKSWVEEAFNERISLSATGFFRGYNTHMDWEKGEGHPFQYCVFGAACSEVEVDCLTGDYKNIRADIIMDTGCSINPAVDVGQIEGAFVQGIGLYTTEELQYSPGGVLLTNGAGSYKIPSVYDIPKEFNVTLLPSSQNSYAIYSSKGIGEAALFLGSVVYFAIKDAVSSARKERGLPNIFKLNSPATPEKIRMACGDKFTEMIPKDDFASFIPWSIDV